MSSLGSFVWSIADQLRGPFKPHQYSDIILPMTILRRLDGIMSAHRDSITEVMASTDNDDLREVRIRHRNGRPVRRADPKVCRSFERDGNPQSYAICKSDMIAKGQDATNIRLGNTLSDDLFVSICLLRIFSSLKAAPWARACSFATTKPDGHSRKL